MNLLWNEDSQMEKIPLRSPTPKSKIYRVWGFDLFLIEILNI